MTGALVTFEGTEGSGKSTQIALLAEALGARGMAVTVTREPGGTPFGASLRGLLLDPAGGIEPLAELFLYLADRAQHVATVVRPALERGEIVLCDRFADATAAYQGAGRGIDAEFVEEGSARAAGGVVPDLTVLLEFRDVHTGLLRARRRQLADGSAGVADRFEREEIAFHERVRDGYRRLAAASPGRFRVLAAERRAGELHAEILAAVLAVAGARQEGGA